MRISDWSSDVCSSDLDGSGGVISVKKTGNIRAAVISTAAILLLASPAAAHKLRVSGEAVAVADSGVTVTPGRDWNRLDAKAGKNTETWTLDGEQLNDVTFRSEEHTSELQSLMRISYAVFCLTKKNENIM